MRATNAMIFALGVTAMAALSACASTKADGVAGVVGADETCSDPDGCRVDLRPDPSFTENFRRQYHRFLLGNFGEFEIDHGRRPKTSERRQYLRVVISPSFQSPLLVSANWYDYGVDNETPEPQGAFVYAKSFGPSEFGPSEDRDMALISFSGYSIPKEYGVVTWSKDQRETYATKLHVEEFEAILTSEHRKAISKQPFVRTGDGFCADGTTYFVDAEFDDERFSFARHSCDPGFVEDFASVVPLMRATASKFPAFAEIISTYDRGIISNTIDH